MLQDRVRGKQYESFIDEVISALRRRYGETLIIHWEDFGVGNSFSLLDKYRGQVRVASPDESRVHLLLSLRSLVLNSVALYRGCAPTMTT